MQSPSDTRLRSADTTGLGVAMAGMLLIASTYGMARFGVGLLAPRLALDRPELVRVLGFAGTAQFASYALAAAVAVPFSDRRPRAGLLLAGATATLGCVGVALAPGPVWFVAAVFVGGMGAGFASPALVRVVDAVVADRAAPTAQSLVNTGTAVGVVVAGVLAFLTRSTVTTWSLMAGACAASAGAVLLLVRGRAGAAARTAPAPRATRGPTAHAAGLRTPCLAALVVGAGSSLIWTFGPLLVTESGPVRSGLVGWLWIALGLGGLLGPFTGVVVGRLGSRGGWRVCVAVLALSDVVLVVALGARSTGATFAAMAVFGAGYMSTSGVLILWAREVWPGAAGAGTAVLFIALALGQALGSTGFELLRGATGPTTLAWVATALCVLGALVPGLARSDLSAGRTGPLGWQNRTSRLAEPDLSAGRTGPLGWQNRTPRPSVDRARRLGGTHGCSCGLNRVTPPHPQAAHPRAASGAARSSVKREQCTRAPS